MRRPLPRASAAARRRRSPLGEQSFPIGPLEPCARAAAARCWSRRLRRLSLSISAVLGRPQGYARRLDPGELAFCKTLASGFAVHQPRHTIVSCSINTQASSYNKNRLVIPPGRLRVRVNVGVEASDVRFVRVVVKVRDHDALGHDDGQR